jgi:ubiquinone/menaquinone biosynthesis C-methylase UbiE
VNALTYDCNELELGVYCADFYNHPIVLTLLDGIFHPGGLALSRMMVDKMNLEVDSQLLDLACGDGKTAAYLAKVLGIQVHGIDISREMIDAAQELAKTMRVENRVELKVALASEIPYKQDSFDAVISECALCSFYNKESAVAEISRVLKPGGVVGLNDVTVRNHDILDDELRGLLGRVTCVADALSSEEYIDLFTKNGFELLTSSVHSDLLDDMAQKARTRARFFSDVNEDLETRTKMKDAVRIIDMIVNQIASGNIGYKMFIFKSL